MQGLTSLREQILPYTIDFDQGHQCAVVRFSGRVDIKLVREFIADAARFLAQHDCVTMLTDGREIDLALSTVNILDMARMASEAGLGRLVRRSLVVKEITPDFEFYEAAAVNRGQNLRIFTDLKEARRWTFGSTDQAGD